jgi:hypothetical protein
MRKILAAALALFLYAGAVKAMTPTPEEEDCAVCCPYPGWICFPMPPFDACEPGIGNCPA